MPEHGPGRCVPIHVAGQWVAVDRAIRAEQLQNEEADAGNAALPAAREFWRHPTWNELSSRRTHTDAPCSTRCGRCSRCARSEAAARNMTAYGSPDYPGRAA